MWPAFWMLPSEQVYGGWAASGEIDVVEVIGNEPERALGTIHYGAPSPGNVFTVNDFVLDGASFAEDFHVFAVEWHPGIMRWFVDDSLYATVTDWYSTGGPFPAPFDQDFHLLLNLAVGGTLPGNPDATTVFPQEFVIDYVRVFQTDNTPPTVAITGPNDGAVFLPGSPITIRADATDTDGSVFRVRFFQGDALLEAVLGAGAAGEDGGRQREGGRDAPVPEPAQGREVHLGDAHQNTTAPLMKPSGRCSVSRMAAGSSSSA